MGMAVVLTILPLFQAESPKGDRLCKYLLFASVLMALAFKRKGASSHVPLCIQVYCGWKRFPLCQPALAMFLVWWWWHSSCFVLCTGSSNAV